MKAKLLRRIRKKYHIGVITPNDDINVKYRAYRWIYTTVSLYNWTELNVWVVLDKNDFRIRVFELTETDDLIRFLLNNSDLSWLKKILINRMFRLRKNSISKRINKKAIGNRIAKERELNKRNAEYINHQLKLRQ